MGQFLLNSMYGVIFLSIVYTFMYGNKYISDFLASRKGYDFNSAVEEDFNLAVSLRRCGLYLGIALGMAGVISGPSSGIFKDIVDISLYGALVSILFVFARYINDLFVLRRIDNTGEIYGGNKAVGFVEFGCFVATGIIAMAAVMGSGGGVMTAIVFFLIGQVLILSSVLAYEAITPWGVLDEIKKGNTSAGLKVSGLAIALSIAVFGTISQDFVSWSFNLPIVLCEGVIAIGVLAALSKIVDGLYLPNTDVETEIVRDKNSAAVALIIAMQIAGAVIISAAIT